MRLELGFGYAYSSTGPSPGMCIRNSHRQPNVEAMLAQLLARQAPQREYLTRLLVKDQGRMYFVDLGEVQYLDADGNYVTLHTATGKHIIYDLGKNYEKSDGILWFKFWNR